MGVSHIPSAEPRACNLPQLPSTAQIWVLILHALPTYYTLTQCRWCCVRVAAAVGFVHIQTARLTSFALVLQILSLSPSPLLMLEQPITTQP
jgi:hypothetical protein